jgi:hypothetical protein
MESELRRSGFWCPWPDSNGWRPSAATSPFPGSACPHPCPLAPSWTGGRRGRRRQDDRHPSSAPSRARRVAGPGPGEAASVSGYGEQLGAATMAAIQRRHRTRPARPRHFPRRRCPSESWDLEPARVGGRAHLQRLALSGDSAEAVQPSELLGSGRACHRTGEPLQVVGYEASASVSRACGDQLRG